MPPTAYGQAGQTAGQANLSLLSLFLPPSHPSSFSLSSARARAHSLSSSLPDLLLSFLHFFINCHLSLSSLYTFLSLLALTQLSHAFPSFRHLAYTFGLTTLCLLLLSRSKISWETLNFHFLFRFYFNCVKLGSCFLSMSLAVSLCSVLFFDKCLPRLGVFAPFAVVIRLDYFFMLLSRLATILLSLHVIPTVCTF